MSKAGHCNEAKTSRRLDKAIRIGATRVLAVHEIDADPNQPRKALGDLTEMVQSIKEHGIISPIIVCVDGGRFRVLVGERRLTAARLAGLMEVPVIIRSVDEHKRTEIQLIENVQRKALEPLELARAYQQLIHEHHLSQRELARRIGKSVSHVNETLRILTIESDELTEITRKDVSRSVLSALAKRTPADRASILGKSGPSQALTVRAIRGRSKRQGKGNALFFESRACGVKICVTPVRAEDKVSPNTLIRALEEWLIELESSD